MWFSGVGCPYPFGREWRVFPPGEGVELEEIK